MRPPGSNFLGGRPPRNRDFYRYFLSNLPNNFDFLKIFKIKWAKSEEKSYFRVGGFDGPDTVRWKGSEASLPVRYAT